MEVTMDMKKSMVFDTIFKEEVQKIPYIFRFSRIRTLIVAVAIGATLIGIILMATVFKSLDLFNALVSAGVVMAIFAGWFSLVEAFEHRAELKAQRFTFMYSLAEREKELSKINLLKQKSF